MTRGLEAYESFVGLPIFGGSGSVTIVSSTRSMMIVTSFPLFIRRWLPRCLTRTNPAFSRARMTCGGFTLGSLDLDTSLHGDVHLEAEHFRDPVRSFATGIVFTR